MKGNLSLYSLTWFTENGPVYLEDHIGLVKEMKFISSTFDQV